MIEYAVSGMPNASQERTHANQSRTNASQHRCVYRRSHGGFAGRRGVYADADGGSSYSGPGGDCCCGADCHAASHGHARSYCHIRASDSCPCDEHACADFNSGADSDACTYGHLGSNGAIGFSITDTRAYCTCRGD